MVKNYVEILVEDYLTEMLSKNDEVSVALRHSPDDLARVQVEVLNRVPPFYVTGKEGEVYGFSKNAMPQNKADIMIEITKAIEVVTATMYNKG